MGSITKFIAAVVFIFFVSLTALAGAVTLSGTIYDSSLEPVRGAVVEISFPRQQVVAVNGSYSFEVQPGPYTIKARRDIGGEEFTAAENLTVGAENTKFDLVLLLPITANGLEDITSTLSGTSDATEEQQPLTEPVPFWLFIAALIAVAAIVFAIAWKLKQQPQVVEKIVEPPQVNIELPKVEMPLQVEPLQPAPKMDEFKQKILELLQSKGGAADQKELRRELPWSEARVSIELTELEKMGRIKKIKKGRANLVKVI